ncbi:hypothetical protein AAVH_30824, partial [Aphelenchoides avenae]
MARNGFVSVELFAVVGNTVAFFMAYAAYFQQLVHAGIAVNRYTAFVAIKADRSRKWTQWRLRTAIIVLALLALPGAAPRYIGNLTLVPTPTPGTFAIVRDIPWFFA